MYVCLLLWQQPMQTWSIKNDATLQTCVCFAPILAVKWCFHEHFPCDGDRKGLKSFSSNSLIVFQSRKFYFLSLKSSNVFKNAAGSFLMTSLDFLEDYRPCCVSSGISSVYEVRSCVLPVGWAVGSLAGATHRGRRKESQSEHHRAVIPLDDEVRRRAARPDSDSRDILRSHAVQQKGGLCRREKVSNNSPTPTWKQTTTTAHVRRTADVEQAIRIRIDTKRPGVCTQAPIFWTDIPHRFQGLGWKSIFAVFLRSFLRSTWSLRRLDRSSNIGTAEENLLRPRIWVHQPINELSGSRIS